MSFTIEAGWWIAPFIVTVLSIAIAYHAQDNSPASDYGRIGQGVYNGVMFLFATIIALITWLAWALLV